MCALVAHAFREEPEGLLAPPDSVPESEGWIWVPADLSASAANESDEASDG